MHSSAAVSRPTPAQALTRAAVALHKLGSAQRPPLVVVRRGGDGRVLAVIDAADQRVHSMRSPEQLVEDLASGVAEVAPHDASKKVAPSPGAQFSDESFVGLCWLVGARLGRDVGLAPWLDPATSYRLVKRPDAADLGNDADAKRLVELIAQRERGLATLVDIAQLPHRTVHQLINSLSLCGLLSAGPAPRGPTKPDAPRRSNGMAAQALPIGAWGRWWSRLTQQLKQHLRRR